MGKRRPTLSDQVRDAIDAAGVSRYRICKEAGVGEPTMSRFMAGKGGLSMAALDRVAAVLRLEVRVAADREGR